MMENLRSDTAPFVVRERYLSAIDAFIDKPVVKVLEGMRKGWQFSRSTSKIAYAYLLTPEGVEEKARLAIHFLRAKMQEYDRLKREIEVLQQKTGITEPPAPISQAVENGGHG